MSDEEIDALKHRAMDAFKAHLLYSSATEQVRANVIVDLVQALTELQLEATTADRWLTAACDRADASEAKLATCEKYRDAYAERDRIGTQAVRDLEAKLAKAHEKEIAVWSENYAALERKLEAARADTKKAVEALEVIRDRQYYLMGAGITAQVIARATLAEIEEAKG
jgi:Zn-dependent M32 family carboxypeptidase